MASFNRPSGVDMNDPWTLAIYSQMVLFGHDFSRDFLSFGDLTYPQQRIVQSLAHAQNLEYEYTLWSRQVTVSKPRFNDALAPIDQLLARDNYQSMDAAFSASPTNNQEPTSQHPEFDNIHPDHAKITSESSLFDDLVSYLEQPTYVHNDLSDLFGVIAQENANVDVSWSNLIPIQDNQVLDLSPYQSKLGSRAESRASSMHSAQSNQSRGRGRIAKKFSVLRGTSSVRSSSSSMFSCFDSKSNISINTNNSTTSRQSRRSLDQFAKAAMKAVKAIGACWRCKFLKKPCSEEIPCESCPRDTHSSEWRELGCQRGKLREKMMSVELCLRTHPRVAAGSELGDEPQNLESSTASINQYSQQRAIYRETKIHSESYTDQDFHADSLPRSLNTVAQKLEAINHPFARLFVVSTAETHAVSMQPLDECIRAIIWELSRDEPSHMILEGVPIEDIAITLRSAALHQARINDNQLIAQSLICLRSCLEVMHLKTIGRLDIFLHKKCPNICEINLIANLDTSISRYLDELSRAFLLKDKMRNVRSWWLSGFYSLRIQSFVRTCLIHLHATNQDSTTIKHQGAQQYLHLAVRLFVAYSRSYDPLVQVFSLMSDWEVEDMLLMSEVMVARLAVKYDTWALAKITSSGEYLKQLFDDNGEALPQKVD